MGELEAIRKRVAAFNHLTQLGPHHKTQELLDLEVTLDEIERLQRELKIWKDHSKALLDNAAGLRSADEPAAQPYPFHCSKCGQALTFDEHICSPEKTSDAR